MKKEHNVIEIKSDLLETLTDLSFSNGFDFNHIPFKDLCIREFIDDKDFFKKIAHKVLAEEKEVASKFSKKEISELVKAFEEKSTTGNDINIHIEDTTIYIQSGIGSFKAVFNDSLVPNDWFENKLFELYLEEGALNRAKLTKNGEEGYSRVSFILLCRVLGVLIYLQMPNKEKTISKRTNVQVATPKKKGKSSKNPKKTYIYKTTYKIDNLDLEGININNNCSIDDIARSYIRKTDEWKQRGHWRHYKSGKKVWIKETTKKSKTPINSTDENNFKHYKISRLDL